ncbi:MAG: hypothetical protein KDB27_32530 [Planctomycetales bacterium]|nr:hypothetical protein [Planctomycetales bacterium]
MQLILRITNGSSAGKKLLLRQDQVAKVGSTDWSDFCVPDDSSLAEFHFEVSCTPRSCMVVDRDNNGVKLDGKQVTESELKDGQILEAGQTTFAVQVVGASTCCGADETHGNAVDNDAHQELSDANAIADDAALQRPTSLTDYCESLHLSDEAKALASQIAAQSPLEYLDVLKQNGLTADALCVTAASLPPVAAVRWGEECLRLNDRSLTEGEAKSAEAVQAWLEEPSDENGREAESAASSTDFEGAYSWLAMAAFWSGESIAPAGQASVAPPWFLAAKGVVAAMTLDATSNPDQADAKYAQFLERANAFLLATAE